MDFTNYINSEDVRKYHRTIGYEYNTVEAAWLVSQCQHIHLARKHDAWRWIINNMPDQKVHIVNNSNKYNDVGIHKVLAEYMAMEVAFLEEFKNQYVDWVYVYRYGPRCSDGGYALEDAEGVFSSWTECGEYILQQPHPENAQSVTIGRRILNRGDHFGKYGWIEIELTGWILSMCPEFVSKSGEDLSDLINIFEQLRLEFPVPFKKGDIVFIKSRFGAKEPIVLTDIMENEQDGDVSNMCILGYACETEWCNGYRAVYHDWWCNYMDAEYYRDELSGYNRLLKPISSWIKGELGDGLDLLLAGYHRIMMEEYLSAAVPVMCIKERLKLAGFPADEEKQ